MYDRIISYVHEKQSLEKKNKRNATYQENANSNAIENNIYSLVISGLFTLRTYWNGWNRIN